MKEYKSFNMNELTNNTNIIGVLINKENNSDLLDICPNRDFMDLALVYKLKLRSGSCYAHITYDVMESMGVSESDLYEAAIDNLMAMKASIRDICRVIDDLSIQTYGVNRRTPMYDEPKMFVVSNEDGVFGAINLLRPVIFQLLADRFNSDLYIIPSSIHELIVVPRDPDCDFDDTINDIICSINENEVPYDSVLADHAYLYMRETNSLRIV